MKNLYILFICLFSLSFGTLQAQNTADCICTAEYDPVCSTDGITYGNFCLAECENADIAFEGSCAEQSITFPANVGGNFTYTQILGTNSTATDGPYWTVGETPEWATTIINTDWDANSLTGNFILTINGTPSASDVGLNVIVVNQINSWTNQVVSSQEVIILVLDNTDCMCIALYDPVCGEDGQTYGNSCEAECENVSIAYDGECGITNPCMGEFEIIQQEYIAGFAGMMLHLQVLNTGNDLSTTLASVILANTCASTDQFTFESWATGDVVDMYFNYTCLSMAPFIDPFEATLVISGTGNCAQDISFVFDPQGTNNTEGCTDANGIFYTEGSNWNIDDCTFCSCEDGDIMCMVVDCAMPPCDDPIYIDGQCCPTCEEEVLGCTNPIAVNYNPEANIDDDTCILDPNQETCTYYGETLQLGETITVNGELCTCQTFIVNEWGFDGGAQMFCVPLTDTLGCTSDAGNFYPVGAFMEGECETCICEASMLTIFPPMPPSWTCYEIADCGDGCEFIDCLFGCENGECIELETNCYDDNGISYPAGSTMQGECETCFCSPSITAVFPPDPPSWYCEEIANCGDCSVVDCAPGFFCLNGECLPETDIVGCAADNGEIYPIGYVMEGECEMCFCMPSMATSPLEGGEWLCEEIEDCGEPSDCETVYMDMSIGNDYYESWYPELTYNIIDANGVVIASGTNNAESSTDTLCLPADCNYQVMMDGVSPYGGCELALWTLTSESGEELATNISCDEYWENNSMTYYVDFEIGCTNDCICYDLWAPVCGTNGITYGNDCEAECAGVDFSEGECLPTDFCDQIEVSTETMYNENGQVQLNITVYNNSSNNINYPVFNIESANDYVSIETLFENAYWIGTGESTTNSYILSGGGNAAALIEATYYVSQLNQNAACEYPITFLYEPIWGSQYCFENGNAYSVGEVLTGDDWCETCVCTASDATVFPLEQPTWVCEEIENCGEQINYVLIMYDAWGDGWNGAEMTITNTNGDIVGVYTMEDGDFEAVELDLVDGCYNIEVSDAAYANSEISWAITQNYYPAVYSGGAPFSGVFSLNADCEEDPCNLIDCADGYECVNGDCIIIEPQEYGCELDGELYEFGTTLEQGCNTCFCQAGFNPNANGIWACTEMACGGCTDLEALNYDMYADWDDESCEYGTDPTPNWESPNTGANHTLVLAEDMIVELDGADIQNGDWIGVFYPLNGELVCAGYTIWEGSTTVIPAQGDDTTTEIQDGFNANQEFQWLVWDASTNTTYSMDANYDQNMPSQEQYTTNGISAILTLTAQPLIGAQELELTVGWSLFSTYMVAEVMDAEELFSAFVEDVIIVKNNIGLAYLPSYNFNGVGDLLPGQGYQVKLSNANILTIEGDYLSPEDNPIDLVNGWNLIAYLRTEPADVIAVFEDIEELVIVKDNSGMAYLPEYGFNGIGNMMAGQAYQIKVLAAQQLQYLANNQSYRFEMAAVENNLQHYKTPLNTGANMSLVIEGYQLESVLDFGDEVAVYSTTNQLVGAFVYKDQAIVIPVYGNDDYSKELDGLLKNEALTLKYWSNEKGEEISLITNWDSSTGLFEQNSIQVATIERAPLEFSKIDFEILPNPATHLAALTFELFETSKVEIQVFNILGDLLFNLGSNAYKKGENSVILKVEDYPVGTYLIKLQTSNTVYTKRLLVQ
jgi:hypothetical protein